MTRRKKLPKDPEAIKIELTSALATFTSLGEEDIRKNVLALIPAFHLLRELGSSLVTGNINAARDRIIFYFQKYPRTVIQGDELMVISGISEWARRVRELRVQFGWAILSGLTVNEIAAAENEQGSLLELEGRPLTKMRPEEYILMKDTQDTEAAFRWNVANTIRKSKGSVQDKLLSYFRSNVGKQVSGEELRYVANDKTEWARRTRELRTEEGWPIATRSQGRPDLAIGMYILEEDKQAPEHDRHIADSVRVQVLERDRFSCRKCGWTHEQKNPSDPRKLLELHHRIHHAKGGENSAENLVTLCNVHHDQIHALKLEVDEYLINTDTQPQTN